MEEREELPVEIHHTRSSQMRNELSQRREMVRELLARVRTVLRRGSERKAEVLVVGDLEVDVVRHVARRAGCKLDLRPKEFALLVLLARCQGEVLTRTMIAEQVWDASFDFDSNVVDVTIGRLRQKVDGPFPRPLIHTVRGVGYVLEAR